MFQKMNDYTVYAVGVNQTVDYRIELGKTVSQIAANEQDIVYRQNATFAFMKDRIYRPIGYVVKNGTLIQTTTSASKWSAFVLPKSGRPYIGTIDPKNVSDMKLAFQGTPQIVKNGQVFINSKYEDTPPDVLSSTKRSAIGVKTDGTILMVTTTTHYTLSDLAKLMINIGCIEALNLDGGGSVISNYMNEKPSANERSVSAALLVKQIKKSGDDSITMPLPNKITEFEAALKIIQSKGTIQTPDYWLKNAVKGGTVNGEYGANLIINVANVIAGMDKEITTLKNNQGSTLPSSPVTTPAPEPTKPTTPQPAENPKPWNEVLKLARDTSVYFQVNLKNGTGVLLKDGYILTAKHVVSPNVQMKVQTYDRSWWDIDLISMHPECDIALCRVKKYRPSLPFLPISNKGVKTDQKLASVGHGSNNKWKSKEGALCREQVSNQPWEFDCSLPLTNDDSGSAVVNEYGEIAGIAVDRVSVGVKIGSVRQSVPGAEAINLNHPKIVSWLKDLKIIS